MERLGVVFFTSVALLASGCVASSGLDQSPSVFIVAAESPRAIQVEITNKGTRDMVVSSSEFELLDSAGVYHDASPLSASNATVRSGALDVVSLAPGGHARGWISFDVSKAPGPYRLRFSSHYGGEQWFDFTNLRPRESAAGALRR